MGSKCESSGMTLCACEVNMACVAGSEVGRVLSTTSTAVGPEKTLLYTGRQDKIFTNTNHQVGLGEQESYHAFSV